MQSSYNIPGDLLWSIVARLGDDDDPANQMLAHRLRLMLEEQKTGKPLSPPLSEEELKLRQEILQKTREWHEKNVAANEEENTGS